MTNVRGLEGKVDGQANLREVEDAEKLELEEKIKELGRKVDDYDKQNLKPKMNAMSTRLDKMENDTEKLGRDYRDLRCIVDEHKEQLMSMTGTLYNSSTKDDIIGVKDQIRKLENKAYESTGISRQDLIQFDARFNN
jgi:hypothetical protein